MQVSECVREWRISSLSSVCQSNVLSSQRTPGTRHVKHLLFFWAVWPPRVKKTDNNGSKRLAAVAFYGTQAVLLCVSFFLLSCIITSLSPAARRYRNSLQKMVTFLAFLLQSVAWVIYEPCCLNPCTSTSQEFHRQLTLGWWWTKLSGCFFFIRKTFLLFQSESRETLMNADGVMMRAAHSGSIMMSYILTYVVTSLLLIGSGTKSLFEYQPSRQVRNHSWSCLAFNQLTGEFSSCHRLHSFLDCRANIVC